MLIFRRAIRGLCVVFAMFAGSPSFSECIAGPGGIGAICSPASVTLAGSCAPGGSNTDCTKIDPNAPKPEDSGSWQVSKEKSALDDSESVYVSVGAQESLASKYGGGSSRIYLFVRCQEGVTAALFTFGDHFMSDIQGYGRIDYRVDDKKASHLSTITSTDNNSLGLWSGKRAIPFIKAMMAGDKLVIRATPYGESPVKATFPIAGLTGAVTDLRKACKW